MEEVEVAGNSTSAIRPVESGAVEGVTKMSTAAGRAEWYLAGVSVGKAEVMVSAVHADSDEGRAAEFVTAAAPVSSAKWILAGVLVGKAEVLVSKVHAVAAEGRATPVGGRDIGSDSMVEVVGIADGATALAPSAEVSTVGAE